jgi:hypothetical protein
VRFELTREHNPLPVFKTGALNHSATLPTLIYLRFYSHQFQSGPRLLPLRLTSVFGDGFGISPAHQRLRLSRFAIKQRSHVAITGPRSNTLRVRFDAATHSMFCSLKTII